MCYQFVVIFEYLVVNDKANRYVLDISIQCSIPARDIHIICRPAEHTVPTVLGKHVYGSSTMLLYKK